MMKIESMFALTHRCALLLAAALVGCAEAGGRGAGSAKVTGEVSSPPAATAPAVEQTRPWGAGKATQRVVANGKTQVVEWSWAPVNGEIRGTGNGAGRSYAFVTPDGLAFTKAPCWSNGQQCNFSGAKFLEASLQPGSQWSPAFDVEGDTFTAHVIQTRRMEAMERVSVAGSEFAAARVSFTGKIRATDKSTGNTSTGTERGTDWVSEINGHLHVVKTVYQNSYGERFSSELLSIEHP